MDYSQFLLLKEELSLILVIVILFVADLFMSPDAHKNDGKPVLNTMLPVALLTIHTLITSFPVLWQMLSAACITISRYRAS